MIFQSLNKIAILLATRLNTVKSSDISFDSEQGYYSLIGNTNFEQYPSYFNSLEEIMQQNESMGQDSRKRSQCDPEDVDLTNYPQWNAEVGYWIGEYTFLGGDGNPYMNSAWNYPYDHYKGFITGNVKGNKYRQRNVFLYPPQSKSLCDVENPIVGKGKCGRNGNTKIFSADQSALTCSNNTELEGDIEGPYQGVFKTQTELIGRDNAILYQVYLDKDVFQLSEDQLYQSQLTTITMDKMTGNIFRTRTAQSFPFAGSVASRSASYYREKRVPRKEFYETLFQTRKDYRIKQKDFCGWENDSKGQPVLTGFNGNGACRDHLEESFEL